MRGIQVEESVVAKLDDETKKVSYDRSSSSSSSCSLSTGFFMRIHDLEFSNETRETVCIDPDVNLVIEKLFQRGYEIIYAGDDNGFAPTKETAKLLRNRTRQDNNASWPIHPWNPASGKEVLAWTGCPDKKGFGHDWPMVKTRCLLKTSSRAALDFLWDSKMVKNYNKMNVLRQDELIIQDDLNDTGCAKIVRSWNKPKWIPQTVETMSLLHARALPNDCYLLVSRSLWEGESFNFKPKPCGGGKRVIRSEILVGVTLLRPVVVDNTVCCEMTSVTHIYSQALKRILAARIAPTSAVKMVREMQLYIETNSLGRE